MNNKPDIFKMGDDWEGKFNELRNYGCQVVYIPRTEAISSSMIKKK